MSKKLRNAERSLAVLRRLKTTQLSLDEATKKMLSWVFALLISIGVSSSAWLTMLDKDFESKKEILELMYLQEKSQMSGNEFIKEFRKEKPQEYCLNISNIDNQKTCRLTLYKYHEINWWAEKIALYVVLAALSAFCLLSMALYRFIRPIFLTTIPPFIASAIFFSGLYILFIGILNSSL